MTDLSKLNLAPLTQSINPSDVDAATRQSLQLQYVDLINRPPLAKWRIWLAYVCAAFVILDVIFSMILVAAPWADALVNALELPWLAAIVYPIWTWIQYSHLLKAQNALQTLRRRNFAAANSLTFQHTGQPSDLTPAAAFAGLPFLTYGQGAPGGLLFNMAYDPNRDFLLSDYNNITDQTSVSMMFARIKLSRPVPHFLLESPRNEMNFQADYFKVERFNLEGDFDKYFRLYGAAGYDIDARQIFTPDVMAALIDVGRLFDVETVGSYLFIYDNFEFKRGSDDNDQILAKLLQAAAIVGAQVEGQAKYYSDDRVAGSTWAMPSAPPPQLNVKTRRVKAKNLFDNIVIWLVILAVIGGIIQAGIRGSRAETDRQSLIETTKIC
ncbi:MAG: hypothetical protein LBM73_00070 [Candidatus Nomurabacteria bacterium]|jgi:hypothetical protein|nr:hypothetical protein [Candidatus Nomurabacteria bacterium]